MVDETLRLIRTLRDDPDVREDTVVVVVVGLALRGGSRAARPRL